MGVTIPSEDRYFGTEHLEANLKGRSVRGVAATFVGHGVQFFLQLGSTMILARLLTPKDFGLIAMVTAVTAFIMIFKSLGLSQATVQRAEINHSQVSTLFWINVAVGTALMLITLALAPALAWFYNDPRLVAVTAVISTAFLFSGLTVQHEALLRRQMRLTTVAVRDVAAMAAGIVTGILCAWAGLGYWSLIWMQVARAVTNAAGVWLASGWIPGRPVRRSGVRSMLKFGGWLTGFGLVNYFSRNFDKLLLGRFWGALTLGLYSRAYFLLLFPIAQITSPLTSAAVPGLSRLQNQPDRYRSYYMKAIMVIAYLSMPIAVVTAVLSGEIIYLALGRNWMEASPLFKILAIAAIWQPTVSTVGWILISRGQTGRLFVWSAITAPLRVVSYIVALPWGATGVAVAYTAGTIILVLPTLMFCYGRSPIKVSQVLLTISRPLSLSLIMGLVMSVTHARTFEFGMAKRSVVSLALGTLVLLVTARCLKPIWADVKDVCRFAELILKRSPTSKELQFYNGAFR